MGIQVNPYVSGTGPFPAFRRAMVFIDGENLVCRYQAMLEHGSKPNHDVSHRKDVFVWSKDAIRIAGQYEIERATMYTYTTGSPEGVENVSDEIKNLRFTAHLGSQLPNTLFPQVFWKQKGTTGKGVDIQMTVDILTHAYHNNYDILYLITGDGDYFPLLKEVMRFGKQVYIAALSNGLSPKLKNAADAFIDLDPIFFVDASNA